MPPPTAADIAKAAPTVTPGRASRSDRVERRRTGAPTTTATAALRPRPEPTAAAPAAAPAPARVRAGRGTSADPLRGEAARNPHQQQRPLFSRKGERAGVEAFYRERNYAPLWVNNGAPSARATEAIAYLRGVDADGLEPADYPVPDFKPADPPRWPKPS